MQFYTKVLIGMTVGVVFGFLLGPNSGFLPATGVIVAADASVVSAANGSTAVPEAMGVQRMAIVSESSGDPPWLEVSWTLRGKDVVRLAAAGIRAKAGDEQRGWVQEDRVKARRYAPLGQTFVDWTEWIGRLFLAMIKMAVVPLVFFSLIVGMASLGDFRKLGRMGGVTLGFFTVTTMIALVIGLTLANVLAPGDLISDADKAILLGSYTAKNVMSSVADSPSMVDQIVNIVPSNPIGALASGEMLQVIFFAAMIGVSLTLMDTAKAKPVIQICDSINEVMVMLVHIAMKLAPYGVAALLFEVVGSTGLGVLVALAAYGGVVILGLLCHILIAYLPVIVAYVRLPFLGFLQSIRSALVLAFSTSSSSATLPVTMEAVESNLKVSGEVASFVLPIGATVNMDGTALYQGVAAIFIAQIYGIDLTVGDQATIVISATMASIGAAGVPGAGMLTLAMVLAAVGVPVEGVALIIGVDRILDMFRTTTNVIGDSTATVLVARLQGDPLRIVTPEEDAADPTSGMEGRLENVEPHPVVVDETDDAIS
jgi:proton glutamate symport protein